MDDVEESLIARSDDAVGEVVRMRVAPVARDGVDSLHLIGAEFVEPLVREGDDLVLADTRFEHIDDVLVDPVDHRGGLVEQHDLVDRLDLARVEHQLLRIHYRQPLALHLEEEGRLDDVDSHGQIGDAGLDEEGLDLADCGLHESRRRRDGTAHPEHSGMVVFGLQPRRVELVMAHGRAEVPELGFAAAGQERVPGHLVAQRTADPGLRGVPDVVEVEQEERAALAAFERLHRPIQAVRAKPVHVDAHFVVDVRVPWRLERDEATHGGPLRVRS